MRDITELPQDLFLLVVRCLPPQDCVRCSAVNRQWNTVFTSEPVSLLLLRWNFPRCRELRLKTAASNPPLPPGLPKNALSELEEIAAQPCSWPATFASVARRYFHLSRGRPWVIEKLELAPNGRKGDDGLSFKEVAPWNRFLRHSGASYEFNYPDPVWWYSQEDGLLVYPRDPHNVKGEYIYVVLDLATGQWVRIPFWAHDRHVRRVRLAQGVLIFEWAEEVAYHQLNLREVVHRHFVTAYDVFRKTSQHSPTGWTWEVEFRSEWKLHFLGLPLNRSDRFISTHTATHYAVYFWQPNRSLYNDDPIEQLAVWDISSPDPYRPSEDTKSANPQPSAAQAPPSLPPGLWQGQNSDHEAAGAPTAVGASQTCSLDTVIAGPRIVRRMAWEELDFYGLRQWVTPRIRALSLDSHNLYVVEEGHRWADGQHSALDPPRAHLVRTTGIPMIPTPTVFTDGDQLAAAPTSIIDGPVNGPFWVDWCGAHGDSNMCYCSRVADADGTPTPSPSRPLWLDPTNTRPLIEETTNRPPIFSPSKATGWPWAFGGEAGPASVISTESARWPGWAPCWRHDDFPYITVTEMVDFAAGVRVAARQFANEKHLSVHIRSAADTQPAAATPPAQTSPESKAACLPDKMWPKLLAKGHIAGDERWVIGEDEASNHLNVLRF
ncbi:hypothetical protein B0J18DRAFT_433419 [Chaetomium sp. MPI-SDFR-AT-0129]|nr:hypothetical protein B0J18DRAFT_433419 [Chaetomium sp. MPI-SDFR-AT-0129]